MTFTTKFNWFLLAIFRLNFYASQVNRSLFLISNVYLMELGFKRLAILCISTQMNNSQRKFFCFFFFFFFYLTFLSNCYLSFQLCIRYIRTRLCRLSILCIDYVTDSTTYLKALITLLSKIS